MLGPAEEQLHATELARRRSRAAAKAKTARMSSRVRSAKSLRISSSVIPPARYSSTSYTVMRVPLIQGLPLRTAGFTEIRSCHMIVGLYAFQPLSRTRDHDQRVARFRVPSMTASALRPVQNV